MGDVVFAEDCGEAGVVSAGECCAEVDIEGEDVFGVEMGILYAVLEKADVIEGGAVGSEAFLVVRKEGVRFCDSSKDGCEEEGPNFIEAVGKGDGSIVREKGRVEFFIKEDGVAVCEGGGSVVGVEAKGEEGEDVIVDTSREYAEELIREAIGAGGLVVGELGDG